MSSRGEHVDAETFVALAKQSLLDIEPTADLDAMLVTFSLIRAANRVQQDLETSVHRPSGVTWAAFRVLFSVLVVGPMPPSQLAQLSHVSAASISGVLNTLERNGLVVRRPAADDGRSVVVSLTPRGRRATRQLLARNNKREGTWVGALTATERRTLVRLLNKLIVHHPPPSRFTGRPIIGPPRPA